LNGWKTELASMFAEYMAKDVHNALIEVIEKEGAMSREATEAYLNDIQAQGRYQRNVY
jgi:sulfite reductase (NADPH) flavoprotein alpha-component